jgi:hypothetical protein
VWSCDEQNACLSPAGILKVDVARDRMAHLLVPKTKDVLIAYMVRNSADGLVYSDTDGLVDSVCKLQL